MNSQKNEILLLTHSVKTYKKYDVVWPQRKDTFYDYSGDTLLKLQIINLVESESPINFSLIKRRISKGVGFAKGGARVENIILNALMSLASSKKII